MRLAVTTWSFPACSLAELVAIARALGFDAMDLGYTHKPAIDRSRVLSDPVGYGATIRVLDLPVSCLFHRFGESHVDRNLADPANGEANRRDFAAALRFCVSARIPVVMLLPGVVNGRQSRHEAISEAAQQLRVLTGLGAGEGILVAIEPHVGACINSPKEIQALLAEVPGLRLVLDPAQLVCQGFSQPSIEALISHAAHVHLRQARPGALQTPVDSGTIDFAAFLGSMRAAGYQGTAAVEYVHQKYMHTLNEDVLTETIRMRDLVRDWDRR